MFAEAVCCMWSCSWSDEHSCIKRNTQGQQCRATATFQTLHGSWQSVYDCLEYFYSFILTYFLLNAAGTKNCSSCSFHWVFLYYSMVRVPGIYCVVSWVIYHKPIIITSKSCSSSCHCKYNHYSKIVQFDWVDDLVKASQTILYCAHLGSHCHD